MTRPVGRARAERGRHTRFGAVLDECLKVMGEATVTDMAGKNLG